MIYGIRNIVKVAENQEIVRCNNCWNYFYEEVTDERNNNSLTFIWDEIISEFFKGCPLCRTDNYLTDINEKLLTEIQSNQPQNTF